MAATGSTDAMPLGQSREGLPIGVQLVAAHGRETCCQVTAQLEQTVPWKERGPPIHAD
jgi:amidase